MNRLLRQNQRPQNQRRLRRLSQRQLNHRLLLPSQRKLRLRIFQRTKLRKGRPLPVTLRPIRYLRNLRNQDPAMNHQSPNLRHRRRMFQPQTRSQNLSCRTQRYPPRMLPLRQKLPHHLRIPRQFRLRKQHPRHQPTTNLLQSLRRLILLLRSQHPNHQRSPPLIQRLKLKNSMSRRWANSKLPKPGTRMP